MLLLVAQSILASRVHDFAQKFAQRESVGCGHISAEKTERIRRIQRARGILAHPGQRSACHD